MMQLIPAAIARSKIRSIPFEYSEYSSELQFMGKPRGMPHVVKLLQQHDLLVSAEMMIVGLFSDADDLPGIGICHHPRSIYPILFLCERTFASFNIEGIRPIIEKWSSLPKTSWIERLKSYFSRGGDKREILRRLVANGDITEEEAVVIGKAAISFTTILPGDVLVVFPNNQYEDVNDLDNNLWEAGITKAFQNHIQLYRGSFTAEWFERVCFELK